MHYSTMRDIDCMSSVGLTVVEDHDHTGWKSWKLSDCSNHVYLVSFWAPAA